MKSDQSAPGQLADALKAISRPRGTQPGGQPAGIQHGHTEDPSAALWPEHLLREGAGEVPPELTANTGRYPAKEGHGTETATDPS